MISNQEQSYERSSWTLRFEHQTGRQGEREINAGFDGSWTPIPAKPASNQTPFAASLSSATSPSQPGSSTLFKSTATTKSCNNK